jgi:hypothetical protein
VIFWAAVITAIVSVVMYVPRLRRQRPWHVIVNLSINISGLAFFVFALVWATM